MKLSLALGQRRVLSRQTAWGCLTTNLAVPGFGSLAAGRVSGYPQAILGFSGLGLTVTFGLKTLWWFLANWSRIQDPLADPVTVLGEMWRQLEWPGLGILVFAAGWLWALTTGLAIVREAKNAEQHKAPPRLAPGEP